MPWRRLSVLIRHLPEESATYRAIHPADPDAAWGLSEHLLAAAVDALHAANWQRTGGKTPRPDPITRPGAKATGDKRRLGGEPVPRELLMARLNAIRATAVETTNERR